MAVTLTEAMNNAQTDLDVSVIDEFRTNPLMNLVTFDDCVNPSGGGATLTYGYRRLVTAPTAAFRAINSEYTPANVTSEKYTVDLAVLGGSFQIDRVLGKVGPAASGAVSLNLQQKIKATQAQFGDAVINGDSSSDPDAFDGLSKALTGTSTEDNTNTYNWSGTMDEAKAYLVLETVDNLLADLDGNDATAIIGNKKAIQLIKAAARRANQYVEQVGPRDTKIASYGGAVLVDAGYKAGSATEVIPVASKLCNLYAVRFALDSFHAVSTVGGSLVQTWLPDFSTSGAVKTGEVELGPVAVALKKTKGAAVYRKVQVEA